MATPTHEVLVVEDDDTLRDATCEALREQGISCTRCGDPRTLRICCAPGRGLASSCSTFR